MNEETGRQAGLATATDPEPDEVLVVLHVVQGVVESHDPLFIELGLPLEGIGLDDQAFGQVGVLEPELTGILAFAFIFLFEQVGQEASVGEVLVGG